MVAVKKMENVAEDFARVTRDSYEKVVDHAVAMQERNFRFAQGVISDSVEELQKQAKANRDLALELVQRAEKQRDAFQTLAEESLGAYLDLAFAPLSYYREGLETIAR